MGDTGRFDHPPAFKRDRRRAQVVEQPTTATEQDGRRVDPYLVEQPGLDAPLHAGRAAYSDTLVTRRFPCLTNGTLKASGDEGEGRSFLAPFLRDGMGDDKTRPTPWGPPCHALVMSNVRRPVTRGAGPRDIDR